MDKLYLGIDTSCYTTSLAIMNNNGDIVFRQEIVLDVKKNNCGLRQSEAYYQHTFNLPEIIKNMSKKIKTSDIESIAVSVKPRPYIDSYMPVFMSGYNIASIFSSLYGKELKTFTHQDGHFFSSIIYDDISSFENCDNLCVHLSGGTTEFIKYTINDRKVSSEILLETLDISFGQLIDRIGVASGQTFPCGKEMDRLSATCSKEIETFFKPKIKEKGINISGLENKFKKMIDQGVENNEIYKSLFINISNGLMDVINHLTKETHYKNIVFVGGVSSNTLLRKLLTSRTYGSSKVFFGDNENLRDNAAGIAYMNYLGVGYCDTRWQKDFKENNRRSKK